MTQAFDSRPSVGMGGPACRGEPAEPGWRRALAEAVRDPAELCRALELPEATAAEARRASKGFPLCVPRPYLGRIRRGDPTDPLLLQVLPRKEEAAHVPGYSADPLGEATALSPAGLLHKYHGRSLIVAIGRCAVHCRFCFRRHFPFDRSRDGCDDLASALAELGAEPSIEEAILSGGDPLCLSDDELARLAGRLAQVASLKRLRVHTRFPVVIPQRVTSGLLAALRSTRLVPVLVVHVNHAREIDSAVADALGRLVDAGIPVLSQGVLLRGVNDSADALADLYRRLIDLRVMPYYLHQLDPVAGAAPFEVPVDEGRRLIDELRRRLPGYAVPRYVRETPGGGSKEPLA